MSTLKTHNLQSPDAGSVNIALTANAGMIVTGISTFNDQINIGSLGVTTNFTVAGISTFTGNIVANNGISVSGDNLSIAAATDIRFTNSSGTWTGSVPKIQHYGDRLYIVGGSEGIRFREGPTDRWDINGDGHFVPRNDSQLDIGTNTIRVRNGYFDTLYGDGSNLTGITGTTINNNADNRIITGSGSANTLEGEANLTYNGSSSLLGNLATSSTNNLELIRLENSHSDGKLTVMGFKTAGLGSPQTKIYGGNDNSGAASQAGDSGAGKFKVTITNPSGTHQEVIYAENDANTASKFLRLSTNGSERLRITSDGKLLLGSTSSAGSGYKLESYSSGSYNIMAKSTNGNGGYHNFTGQASNGTITSYISCLLYTSDAADE